MGGIIRGNVEEKGHNIDGWFIGNFMGDDSVFKTNEFELKWAVLPRGWTKGRAEFVANSKTMCVLIEGKFEFRFPQDNKKILLEKRGDFVFWDNKIPYISETFKNSVLLVIRWPSIPNDKKAFK